MTGTPMPREIEASAVVAEQEATAFWSLVPRSALERTGPDEVHPVHACSVVGCRISEALRAHLGDAPVIHLGQRVRPHAPIAVGDHLSIEARVTRVAPRATGARLEVVANVTCQGERVLDSSTLLLATSLAGEEPDEPDAALRWPSASLAGRTPAWHDVVDYTLSPTEIARFGLCTGDDQAIHLSHDVARAAGLPGVIAHGMHTVAACYQAVTDEAHRHGERIRDLTVRFARPVRPDIPVVVQVGRVSDGLVVRATARGRALTRGGVARLGTARPGAPLGSNARWGNR